MTEPYYADELVTLFCGDCRDITGWLAADALVTDPPYGRGEISSDIRNTGLFQGSGADRHKPPIAGDEDTSLRDAVLAMWGKRPAMVFSDLRLPVPGCIQIAVYQKPPDAGYRSTAGFRRDAEGVCLLHIKAGYGGRTSIITTSARKSNGNSVGLGARYGHPHAKPVDVLEELIGACPPGVIADPFAGSGTTLLAARNLGRRAIGVELEERYCERAARNLSQMMLEAS